jgi:hypothetical protein
MVEGRAKNGNTSTENQQEQKVNDSKSDEELAADLLESRLIDVNMGRFSLSSEKDAKVKNKHIFNY